MQAQATALESDALRIAVQARPAIKKLETAVAAAAAARLEANASYALPDGMATPDYLTPMQQSVRQLELMMELLAGNPPPDPEFPNSTVRYPSLCGLAARERESELNRMKLRLREAGVTLGDIAFVADLGPGSEEQRIDRLRKALERAAKTEKRLARPRSTPAGQ